MSESLGFSCFGKDVKRYSVLLSSSGFKAKIRMWLYTPGLWVLFCYRLGRSLDYALGGNIICKPLLWLYGFLFFLLRMLTGIDIPLEARIGEGLYIGHYGGIVIHPDVRIGANCNLSHGVTIGEGGRPGERGVPVIGERAYIGPGAKIFGRIVIGNTVAIGANAVVNTSVPDGAVVGGVPARILSDAGSGDFVIVEETAAVIRSAVSR